MVMEYIWKFLVVASCFSFALHKQFDDVQDGP